MASFVLTNAYLSVGAVDLSDYCQGVTLTYECEVQDDTAFGDTTRSGAGGLKNWSLSGDMLQSFSTGTVDLTLFSLVGATCAVIVRSSATAASATNPNFNGTGILTSYQPIGGAVGDIAKAPISIVAAGTLTRTTT